MVTFEGYERRIAQIEKCMKEYGFSSLEEVKQYTVDKGLDVDSIVRGIQPIAFENAIWAYTLGAAVALKKECKKASEAAEAIGIGLQAFCIDVYKRQPSRSVCKLDCAHTAMPRNFYSSISFLRFQEKTSFHFF